MWSNASLLTLLLPLLFFFKKEPKTLALRGHNDAVTIVLFEKEPKR
jgi:hypothetical protein